jgi:hypothetical protein
VEEAHVLSDATGFWGHLADVIVHEALVRVGAHAMTSSHTLLSVVKTKSVSARTMRPSYIASVLSIGPLVGPASLVAEHGLKGTARV